MTHWEYEDHSLQIVVDGNWGAFGQWTSCSTSCGGGTRSRTRSCNNPPPSNGGKQCSGSASETESCGMNKCPGKCKLLKNPKNLDLV